MNLEIGKKYRDMFGYELTILDIKNGEVYLDDGDIWSIEDAEFQFNIGTEQKDE